MKKTLITTLLAFSSCLFVKADASMVIIDYQGPTLVQQNTIEQNLLINSDDGGLYDIALRPLDDALRNTDGTVVIPLEHIYINNTHEDVYFRYHEYSTLFRGLEMGGVAKNMTAKVRDFGMVPAGIYNLNFEIQARDSETQNIASVSTFMLQFVVRPEQSLSFAGEEVAINVDAKDAFAKNKKITTSTNPIIHINSNVNWILSVNTDRFGENAGNYYIRTIASSAQVNERLQERIQLYPDKEIVIAKGKAPSNNEYVSIELAVEGKDGKILKAGNYYNNLRWIS